MIIKRSFGRKIALKNYENCDFFAEFSCECLEKDALKKSKELFDLAKNAVENDIKNLKLRNVEKNLSAKLKIETDALAIAKRTKNEREILDIKFKIGLLKDMIKDCVIL